MKIALLTFLLVLVSSPATGYPDGPPKTPEICMSMFPEGHNQTAMTSEPPYELIVNAGTLTPEQSFTVTLRATGDTSYPYFEGMLVQARMASCYSDKPVGTFSIPADDDFMQLIDCPGRPNGSVAHKAHSHQTSKTFTWTAPKSEPGRIYFRATVVKNTETFWTNVFSDYVEDSTDDSKVPESYCSVQTEPTGAASSLAAVTSIVFAAVVMSLKIYD